MAGWTGSGSFTRIYSWVADAAAGIDIIASRVDDDTNNITSNGFNNCLTRDGQGSASANLPMNGFRHTAVGNGVVATDYVAVGQLQAPGTPANTAIIPAGAYLGEMRETALPETLLATLMPGWHVCSGATRPRTDPLWVAVGAGNWVFGAGNGTTTYTLPDRRGRVAVGKDDMGGSAANRVTNGISGIQGATLGGVGGDQHAQADTITLNKSGSVTAGSSATTTATDAGHVHGYTTITSTGTQGTFGANANFTQGTAANTDSGNAAISASTSVTTTITDTTNYTASSGLSGASQNMPPTVITNIVIFVGA